MKKHILTHIDLDGFVSGLLAKTIFPSAPMDQINYGNIPETVKWARSLYTQPICFIVLDINLPPEKCREILEDGHRLILIDHHEITPTDQLAYKQLLEDYSDDFIYKWDSKVCGAVLTYEFFYKLNPVHFRKLLELVRITDIYDIWRTEHKDFESKALPLNDIFWKIGPYQFIDRFKNGLAAGWDESIDDLCKKIKEEQVQYISETLKKYSISIQMSEGKKLLAIVRPDLKYINLYTIFAPDYDFYVIFKAIENNTKCVLFSLRQKCDITSNSIAASVKKYEQRVSGGGHPKAGGLVFPAGYDLEKAVDLIVTAIEDEILEIPF